MADLRGLVVLVVVADSCRTEEVFVYHGGNSVRGFRVMRWSLRVLGAFLLLARGVSAAPELEVERVLWGFNGKPLAEAFNPLTIEVRNTSEEPYDGFMRLWHRVGRGRLGVPEVHVISLAPGGVRTVQFTPYFTALSQWRVAWEGGHLDLEDVRPGKGPVTVALIDDRRPIPGGTAPMPTFPERYFPTNPSTTEGLEAVVLGSEPRWGEARAKSFLQWLQRGGEVHLFRKKDGSPLRFAGVLGPLSDAAVKTTGYGQIHRYEERLADLSREEAKALEAVKTKVSRAGDLSQERKEVFEAFGLATVPDVPWSLIYFAAFAYILVICPGHYFFARNRRRDYRLTILSLLIGVGFFCWLFERVGRRGYEESGTWLSAAIARPLGDGTHDVLQWSHAFVTKGDSYQFRYPSRHQLFSVDSREPVPGLVQAGAGGFLQIELPLYSSRNLISRAMMQGPEIQVEVLQWAPEANAVEVKIAGEVVVGQAWCRKDKQIIELRESRSGSWVYQDEVTDSFEDSDDFSPFSDPFPFGFSEGSNGERRLERIDTVLPEWLVRWHLKSGRQVGRAVGHAELLLCARAPDAFSPESPAFEASAGHVLYVIPLSNAILTSDEAS